MVLSSDVQHDMLLLALDDALHTSKTNLSSATILDVGTGTGAWACELATRNSGARVYGIDLHQVRPEHTPANVVFETVDVMTGFPFNTGTFDLIHSRLLVGGITDWPSYLENLLRITKRGGCVECIELELRPFYAGTAKHESIDQWTDHMAQVLQTSKLCPDIAQNLGEHMRNAGFEDVEDNVVETPIGDWPTTKKQCKIGELARTFAEQYMIQWLSSALLELGRPRSEIDSLAQQVMQDLSDADLQAHFRWHFVTGRKKR